MPALTMKIVIPMSGFGERCRKAGYTVPKALIEIDGLDVCLIMYYAAPQVALGVAGPFRD